MFLSNMTLLKYNLEDMFCSLGDIALVTMGFLPSSHLFRGLHTSCLCMTCRTSRQNTNQGTHAITLKNVRLTWGPCAHQSKIFFTTTIRCSTLISMGRDLHLLSPILLQLHDHLFLPQHSVMHFIHLMTRLLQVLHDALALSELDPSPADLRIVDWDCSFFFPFYFWPIWMQQTAQLLVCFVILVRPKRAGFRDTQQGLSHNALG